MADNLGNGVSRVLDVTGRQFETVIFQKNKPPLDSEFNLLQYLDNDWRHRLVLRGTPSGWYGNDTNPTAIFQTAAAWSNWFKFGRQKAGEKQSIPWAVVNGWLIPVTGTKTGTPPGSPDDSDIWNRIALDPPPANSGDSRIDFVFLEVWLARVPPNPSVLNKPAAAYIYRYGNVEGGYTYLPDDTVDPDLGFETTERVQVQYRIRVVKGLIGLSTYPDGFDPTVTKAQGTAGSPTSFTFTNMRAELGDPGLWRAGDGVPNALGTVDGYSYAVPLCAVFRRNGVVWNGNPSPNLNGSFNRNPVATDRTGWQTFSTIPALAVDITSTATSLTLSSASNIPLPMTPTTPVLIQIGDELMTYTAITGTTMSGLTRGTNGTKGEAHKSGSTVIVQASRPDGLFSDQVALTDILDLRHNINPSGFDYNALLKVNFDKLLRGQLRSNWKRSGAGPQGPFVSYQDILSVAAPGIGVTKLDAPDNIRMVFSDAAAIQKVEVVVKPPTGAAPTPIGAAWSLGLTATQTTVTTSGWFKAGDVISIPISQFKLGLPGGDTDQVRFLNDGIGGATSIRVDGHADPIPTSWYTVSLANPTYADDLVISLVGGSGFFKDTQKNLYITVHLQYGPGRGLARRPDSIHSINFLSPNSDLLVRTPSAPANNLPANPAWASLWSKFRNATYKNFLPITTDAYADLGSKTVVVSPFRRIVWPAAFVPLDGTAANPYTAPVMVGTNGSATLGSPTFTDGTVNFTVLGVVPGDALVIQAGVDVGKYVIATVGTTTVTLETPLPWNDSGINYSISHAQGLMPLKKKDGTTAKWTTTDPLGLFSGTTDPAVPTKNLYVTLPRHLAPTWGEVRAPILPTDPSSGTFSEGISFMCLSKKGGTPFADGDKNYVPYGGVGGYSYVSFSTQDLGTLAPASYNDYFTYGGIHYAGCRKYTETRGFGRKGLELPPFYGIARLWAVYEASDYRTNGGSSYDHLTRAYVGGHATNLLRQDCTDPTLFIEVDDDGDSTFILNSRAIDLSKAPTPPASFDAGDYVIEASIFGFDRGSFDGAKEFRMVLTRPIASGTSRNQAIDGTRTNNYGDSLSGPFAGPTSVLPGPATSSDQIAINYSRQPYMGDAWGSQTSYLDVGFLQGPLTSASAYQVASTRLDQSSLTRPYQKLLEVLASFGFATTLGTGRLSGDVDPTSLDIRNIGYENMAAYPPASAIDSRPTTLFSAFSGDVTAVGTEFLGCTERLPLGSLFRDKDFRGGLQNVESAGDACFLYMDEKGTSIDCSSLTPSSTLEQSEVMLSLASLASGSPGEFIAHVDGEQGNYSSLVNFRTNRGGSAFTASGPHPGGEVAATHRVARSPSGWTNVLVGRAFLVRNTVQTVGATEVSAGDELMMLVITTVLRLNMAYTGVIMPVVIGTNGLLEGYSAADLYRIEGHPLVKDNVNIDIDPATIPLSRRAY